MPELSEINAAWLRLLRAVEFVVNILKTRLEAALCPRRK